MWESDSHMFVRHFQTWANTDSLFVCLAGPWGLLYLMLRCKIVCVPVLIWHTHPQNQTTCERKCLTGLKCIWICAQHREPHNFMLLHWQLWVIAPCSSPYPWTTFNYVTKYTCSPALISLLESWMITFSLVLFKELASLNHENMFIKLTR